MIHALIMLACLCSSPLLVGSFRLNNPSVFRSGGVKCGSIVSNPVVPNTGSNKVSIANLPFDIDEASLNDLIAKYLGVQYTPVVLATEVVSGRSKGFAHINFETKELADEAVTALSTLVVHERSLRALHGEVLTMKDTVMPKHTTGSMVVSCYIGNLDPSLSEKDFREFCKQHLGSEPDRVRIAIDRATGLPRGYGHIDFRNQEEATRAIATLDGAMLVGRELRISPAGQPSKRDSSSVQSAKPVRPTPSPPPRPADCGVFIGNMAFDVDEATLREMIDDVVGPGLYTTIRMGTDRETGKPRGFAHVNFVDAEAAAKAIAELDGLEVYDRVLRADKVVPASQRPARANSNNNPYLNTYPPSPTSNGSSGDNSANEDKSEGEYNSEGEAGAGGGGGEDGSGGRRDDMYGKGSDPGELQ